jgi:hypothetical protein
MGTLRERRDEAGNVIARRCDEHGGMTTQDCYTCGRCGAVVCYQCLRMAKKHDPCPLILSERRRGILGPAIQKTLGERLHS